jgi:WD40 repeat protein
LISSITKTPDTLFGGCFSDKGDLFAFGAADNRARVIQVKDGKQIMRLDTHSDWVLNTTFSRKSDHLISVSRDMSMKLTIVESAQFVDNITSITPGALKGPDGAQVAVAGFDGHVRLFDVVTGKLVKDFVATDFAETTTAAK